MQDSVCSTVLRGFINEEYSAGTATFSRVEGELTSRKKLSVKSQVNYTKISVNNFESLDFIRILSGSISGRNLTYSQAIHNKNILWVRCLEPRRFQNSSA